MRLIEIYIWITLYWAFYLPMSTFLYLLTGEGDVLGIIVVGLIISAILAAIFACMDGILWHEPIRRRKPIRKLPPEPGPKVEPVQTEPAKADPQTNSHSSTEEEVPHEIEPNPKMRTDVDLDQLDVDDDDPWSASPSDATNR